MSAAVWQHEWLQRSRLRIRETEVWRGVETQYASATTLLVDSLEEHDLLEQMIEESKPPLPLARAGKRADKHYLLITPFRYMPVHSSRFRRAGLHGVWYGAEKIEAACAEVAYWRMRFIRDSDGLMHDKIVTSHTFFAATVDGLGLDLTQPPWAVLREVWVGDDYSHTQHLAEAAQQEGIELIRYESARDPAHACFAVLTPDALQEPRGGLDKTREQWSCTATRDHAMMVYEADRSLQLEFDL